MHAGILVSVLLLFAAGCARSADAPPPAPAAGQATQASPQATQATPQAAPIERPARDGGQQGIRVGEPAPNDPRGPRRPRGSAWHAFGNEPFWSVQLRDTTVVFTTPDDQRGATMLGRRIPSLRGTVIQGSGPKGEFHLGIVPGECSDGMSDRRYDHQSTFIYGGTTYKGCAEEVGY
jgi:uncharacterized membrane protein